MPLLDAKGNVIPITTPTQKDYDIKPDERFHVGDAYEIFKCDDEKGEFTQVAGPLTKEQLAYAWQNLRNFDEYKTVKMFAVHVKRLPILSNFPPRTMRLMQLGHKPTLEGTIKTDD